MLQSTWGESGACLQQQRTFLRYPLSSWNVLVLKGTGLALLTRSGWKLPRNGVCSLCHPPFARDPTPVGKEGSLLLLVARPLHWCTCADCLLFLCPPPLVCPPSWWVAPQVWHDVELLAASAAGGLVGRVQAALGPVGEQDPALLSTVEEHVKGAAQELQAQGNGLAQVVSDVIGDRCIEVRLRRGPKPLEGAMHCRQSD